MVPPPSRAPRKAIVLQTSLRSLAAVALSALAVVASSPVERAVASDRMALAGAVQPVGFSVSIVSGGSLTNSPLTFALSGGVATQSVSVLLRPVNGASSTLVSGTTDEQGAFSASTFLPATLAAGDYELLSDGPAVGSTQQVIATFSVASTSIVTNTSPQDGALELIMTAQSVANFQKPLLVSNRSETLGALGAFSVRDGRSVSKPGWTLTANVLDFVNAASANDTIAASNLGLAPAISQGSTASGVHIYATTAGAASYPTVFAEASAGSGVGTTTLTSQMLLIAPRTAPAGTYTSTLTLTLVSK